MTSGTIVLRESKMANSKTKLIEMLEEFNFLRPLLGSKYSFQNNKLHKHHIGGM
jgi:hypothetical protein